MEVIQNLISKLLDFFNVGRLFSIIAPGFLITFSAGMLFSTLALPQYQGGAQKVCDAKAIQMLSSQILFDFGNCKNNLGLLIFVGMIVGVFVYETANFALCSLSGKSGKFPLCEYDASNDFDSDNKKKFGFSNRVVGLVYFAPFLKENFSGKENYYNFLISEYYRFLELSVVVSIGSFISAVISVAYYIALSNNVGCFVAPVLFGSVIVVLLLILSWFYFKVVPEIFYGYKKACSELVLGVTAVMSKGLTLAAAAPPTVAEAQQANQLEVIASIQKKKAANQLPDNLEGMENLIK